MEKVPSNKRTVKKLFLGQKKGKELPFFKCKKCKNIAKSDVQGMSIQCPLCECKEMERVPAPRKVIRKPPYFGIAHGRGRINGLKGDHGF